MGKMTAQQVAALRPRDKPYKQNVDTGLQLRIATNGIKVWVVQYVVEGRQRELRLSRPYGMSTTDASMSLADARNEAARIRTLAREGVDIQVQQEEERLRELQAAVDAEAQLASSQAKQTTENLSVAQMFDAWLLDGVRRKDGNAELRRSFGADVLPAIGAIAIKDLTEHDLRGVLRTMVARGVNRAAVMVRNSLTQMFAWAEKRQPWRKLLIDGNPMELIEIEKIVAPDYDMSNERDRILADAEIGELQAVFDNLQAEYDAAPDKRYGTQPLAATTQRAIWIMLSTLCRVGEMSMARWVHVDLDAAEWFIPKENVKDNLADLTVYLSPFALDQFRQLQKVTGKTEWCFPARNNEGHVDSKSISKQVGDRQSMFKKAKDGGPRAPMKNRRHDNTLVLGAGKTGAWTPHDLRRTGATLMQRLGVSLDIIDRCQNHVLPGSKVRRHYLHHDYADEKRDAWKKIGEHIETILS
ncbi:tyrosine-type recombinase/integrase [Massilia sp. CCM 8733]|uniref:Tyrosine-type recombinase/integrase n=1 Tax=Massilia mucilaginosa TaxID=2609282 RepID=A0ABX0P2B7_9BURK|nr:site-specific integrase [Massilia mucilaginosa]NHZ93227.1 tyrosine-type recombinase/integrase [Massilia mucilaginosa]